MASSNIKRRPTGAHSTAVVPRAGILAAAAESNSLVIARALPPNVRTIQARIRAHRSGVQEEFEESCAPAAFGTGSRRIVDSLDAPNAGCRISHKRARVNRRSVAHQYGMPAAGESLRIGVRCARSIPAVWIAADWRCDAGTLSALFANASRCRGAYEASLKAVRSKRI